ncbi:MAG: hypothetical protein LUG62_08285 [Clostridiales bacterium]|nr:hypothetical protein [Clostridiales bacterium]
MNNKRERSPEVCALCEINFSIIVKTAQKEGLRKKIIKAYAKKVLHFRIKGVIVQISKPYAQKVKK